MGITHSWNGTILTITSDSGTSSADLKGDKGDDGARGAQGARGLDGKDAKVDLTGYSTIDYVDNITNGLEENKADKNTIPTKVSQLDNDTNFVTGDVTDTLTEQLNIERERINQIAMLESGSTTGDAELVDARVDYTGKAWLNTGEHIRGVSSQLSSQIDELIGGGITPKMTNFFDYAEKSSTNKINPELCVFDEAIDGNGNIVPTSGVLRTDYLEVDNTHLTVKYGSNVDRLVSNNIQSVSWYNNDTFISRERSVVLDNKVVPENANRCIVVLYATSMYPYFYATFTDGSTNVEYEDYYEPILDAKIKPQYLPQNNFGSVVDLFMFMGQSNMAGRGVTNSTYTEEAPTIIDGAGYEFRAISDATQLYPIQEPFGVNENNPNGISEETKTGSMVTAFANAYYTNNGNIPIVGVSASKGGSRISYWQPNGSFFNDALARLNSAVNWLVENGYTIRHKYMLWCQGESDGDDGTEKEVYLQNFNAFLDGMINAGIEKMFMVRIGNCNIEDSFDRYTNMIKWQNEIAKTNKNVVMVSTDFAGMRERGLMKDDFHYYQTGYNEVGTNAGVNTAYYVNTSKEPTMYDTEDGTLYFSHKN